MNMTGSQTLLPLKDEPSPKKQSDLTVYENVLQLIPFVSQLMRIQSKPWEVIEDIYGIGFEAISF